MKTELRQKVWNKYNKRCAYCGTELEYKQLQIDHIYAKYLGGSDELSNYNPSCRGCNFYKSTFTIDGFRTRLKSLHERLFKIFIVKMAVRYGIISYKPFSEKFYFETLTQALPINDVSNSLSGFRKWQKENWKDVYLMSDDFMIKTYLDTL